MHRIILQSSITVGLIAIYSVSLTLEQPFVWNHQHPEVTDMQFLLPEFIPGCKSTPHLQNEENSARLRRLDTTVETLRSSYEAKDIHAFISLFTPLQESAKLLDTIQNDLQHYETISLTFSIDRIVIAQHNYAVHLHWEGSWQTPEQALPRIERGLSVFKFTGDQQITLQSIEGDNPFGIDRTDTS